MRKIRGFGRGRWRMLSLLVLAGLAAGTIGLSPVFGGGLSGASISSAFEAGVHRPRLDQPRRPRRPHPGGALREPRLPADQLLPLRQAHPRPGRVPARSARAVRAGGLPEGASPPLPDHPRRRAAQPGGRRPAADHRCVDRPHLDAGPGHQLDPAPHREGALVRLPREGHLVRGAHGRKHPGRQLGRGLRLRPRHRRQRPPRPADRSRHGQALQHLVRRSDPPARRTGRRRGRELQVLRAGRDHQVPRPRRRADVQPLQRDLDLPGPDGRRALVPDAHRAGRRARGDRGRPQQGGATATTRTSNCSRPPRT